MIIQLSYGPDLQYELIRAQQHMIQLSSRSIYKMVRNKSDVSYLFAHKRGRPSSVLHLKPAHMLNSRRVCNFRRNTDELT